MLEPGYYRQPAIHDDTLVFVSEDDLWQVAVAGGPARRLTSGPGRAGTPSLSPDGAWLAFTGRDEGGPEVYVMPAGGGPAERVTYLGADTRVVGWHPDGERIVLASNSGQPFLRQMFLYAVPRGGGALERLSTGPAFSVSFGAGGGRVIGRHLTDIARWKRYRGGLSGELWVDRTGSGPWARLVDLPGNLTLPLWLGDRIYFVSDHEAVGNLYSCTPDGGDLRRHTRHQEYYVRHPATDGRRIAYHAGGDLYVFDPTTDDSTLVPVEYGSPRAERRRKFVEADKYLQSYDPHPKGHSVALTTRGKAFSMAAWEGAVTQHGTEDGVRYRLATWLFEGERIVLVSDASGEEALEVHRADGQGEPARVAADIGRPVLMQASPVRDLLALTNHRHELVVVDLEAGTATVLDRSPFARLDGLAWSPDGRWLAYGFANSRQTSVIKLAEVATGETHEVTSPVLHDGRPAFDPDGKYLYFLSTREFDPVYDGLHFELAFPWGMRPYLVTLRADLPDPFRPRPRAPGAPADKGAGGAEGTEGADDGADGPSDTGAEESTAPVEGTEPAADAGSAPPDGGPAKPPGPPAVGIDLAGLRDRIAAFPVENARYGQIVGLPGKVLFTVYPLEGELHHDWRPGSVPAARGRLKCYDLTELKCDELVSGVTDMALSLDNKTMALRAGNRLRMLRAGAKPGDKASGSDRESGWLSLRRVKVSVAPPAEWRQMFREAWRLQRDQFWSPDMSGVDWERVYARYLPLLDRVGTRLELSDLLWEMQGELGTSHAYEFGGDYRPEPSYQQGLLGADVHYDAGAGGYVVDRVVRGDPWEPRASSPLARVGAAVAPGEVIVALDGRPLGPPDDLGRRLVNRAGGDVRLTIRAGEAERDLTVTTLPSETPARYRDWVTANRARVHDATGGRAGYVHIPDMGPHGFAEFHRSFLAELDREGLVVDVRYNGGGHVSQLLLEKLARRRIGYDVSRWVPPVPYPAESVMGPLVTVTNEMAGSDGDMFTHAFKLMGLGAVVGKRTWGGVVGISVRDSLVDGGVTTQPEFSFWFADVGWGLENFGAEPDIEVDVTPDDWTAGRDPQLDVAVAEILRRLDETPPRVPDFGERPSRALPDAPSPG